MNTNKLLTVIILFFIFIINCYSNKITLKSSIQDYPIKSIEILEDANAKILADDLITSHSNEFKKVEGNFFDFSFSDSFFWIKFSVENQLRKGEEIIIETPYFPNLSIQFFIFSESGVLEKRYLQNYIKHRNLNLILNIPKGESKIVVIRCIPEGRPMKLPIHLWTKKGFSQKIIKEYSIIFLYFGTMLFLSGNCIILGYIFKSKSYTAFGIYILTFILLIFYSLELPKLFGVSTITITKITKLTFFLNVVSILIFTQIYFRVKQKLLNFLFWILEILCAYIMTMLLISKSFSNSLSLFTMYISFIGSITILIILTVIYHYRKKRKDTIYFSAAMSPYLVAFIFNLLEFKKIIPSTPIIEYSLLIGGFTSVVLFYLLIGQRIKGLYREKEESQKNIILLQKENNSKLEKLVDERTIQLEEKNILLEKQRKIMENKKEALRSLLIASSNIQRIRDIDDSTSSLFDQVGKSFKNISYGIILNGKRESIINSIYFYNTTSDEKEYFVNFQDSILEKSKPKQFKGDKLNILKRYIFIFNQSQKVWSILPLYSSNGTVLGKFLIKLEEIPEHYLEVINIFVDQITVISENLQLTNSLEKMANTDSLTGVYNRNFFDNQLKHHIELADKHHINFSIITIDINGLKRINDIYGHAEGDKLIIKAAEVLKEVVRTSDILARIGGDEFIILCPSTEISGAEKLANRIKQLQDKTSLCFISFDNQKSEELCIHMSIGVSSSSIISSNVVIKDADKKMYADKEEYYKNREKYRENK